MKEHISNSWVMPNLLLVLCAAGCCTSQDQDGAGSGSSVTNQIGPGGGLVTLEKSVSVIIPAGLFSTPQSVVLAQRHDSEVETTARSTSILLGITNINSVPIKLTLPTIGTNAALVVEPLNGARAPASETIPLALISWRDSTEQIDVFEPLVRLPSTNGANRFELPFWAMSPSENGSLSAWVIFVSTGAFRPAANVASERKPESRANDFVPTTEIGCQGGDLHAPISGDVDRLKSSDFGLRADPFSGRLAYHKGVDYGVPSGTPVLAMYDGEIMLIGEEKKWGQFVVLKQDNGHQTLYAHLQPNSFPVSQGTRVRAGDRIALSGQTGAATGPHLHVEYVPQGPAWHSQPKRIDPHDCIDSNRPAVEVDVFRGSSSTFVSYTPSQQDGGEKAERLRDVSGLDRHSWHGTMATSLSGENPNLGRWSGEATGEVSVDTGRTRGKLDLVVIARAGMKRMGRQQPPSTSGSSHGQIHLKVLEDCEYEMQMRVTKAGTGLASYNGGLAGSVAGEGWKMSQGPDDAYTSINFSDRKTGRLAKGNDIEIAAGFDISRSGRVDPAEEAGREASGDIYFLFRIWPTKQAD